MTRETHLDVPPQEREHYFNSFLLNRDIDLDEMDSLTTGEIENLMAECAAVRNDPNLPTHLRKKQIMAGYFFEKGKIILDRRARQ